jgi:hypothetical protein
MTPFIPWAWREPEGLAREPVQNDDQAATADLDGYKVEALDGSVGSVDEASYDVDDAWLVVDTGPWIFGKKVLLPAGTVQHFDHAERKVYVDRTKAQIKDSPEYDKNSSEYRQQVGEYYTGSYDREPNLR